MKKDKITFILTSCGRLDLLERTLDSFFKFNTAEIERYIITEDSADPEVFKACETLNKEKYSLRLDYGGPKEYIVGIFLFKAITDLS